MHAELENIFTRLLDLSKTYPQLFALVGQISQILNEQNLNKKNRQFAHWQKILSATANFGQAESFELNSAKVSLKKANMSKNQIAGLKKLILKLAPWRKGPFELFGLHIDSEWQSNLKWDRLIPHLNVKDKIILDIGCSNAYYAWRTLGLDASLVVGIDPSILFFCQFLAIKQALPANAFLASSGSKFPIKQRIFHLPVALEDIQKDLPIFDIVFNMGVLYHRQSPIDHLNLIYRKLKKGGEFFLETLVIEGSATEVLVPEGDYAGMSNVWFLPSVKALKIWLKKIGFVNIKVLDLNQTNTEEQRSTEFMHTLSLKDFLSADLSTTKEGLPPPLRLILRAQKP